MKVEFSTVEFEMAHGKQPRGEGSWAFFIGSTTPWWAPHSTFTQAKRAATAEAKRRNVRIIIVGS